MNIPLHLYPLFAFCVIVGFLAATFETPLENSPRLGRIYELP